MALIDGTKELIEVAKLIQKEASGAGEELKFSLCFAMAHQVLSSMTWPKFLEGALEGVAHSIDKHMAKK